MAAKDPDTVTASESFVGAINGKEYVIRAGEMLSASHPAVKKWPQFFRAPNLHHEAPIEQATAAPGEKR